MRLPAVHSVRSAWLHLGELCTVQFTLDCVTKINYKSVSVIVAPGGPDQRSRHRPPADSPQVQVPTSRTARAACSARPPTNPPSSQPRPDTAPATHVAGAVRCQFESIPPWTMKIPKRRKGVI